MRLVGRRAQAFVAVLLVLAVIAVEPDHLTVTLEGQDVGRDAVEEPAIVADHDRAAGELEQRIGEVEAQDEHLRDLQQRLDRLSSETVSVALGLLAPADAA